MDSNRIHNWIWADSVNKANVFCLHVCFNGLERLIVAVKCLICWNYFAYLLHLFCNTKLNKCTGYVDKLCTPTCCEIPRRALTVCVGVHMNV